MPVRESLEDLGAVLEATRPDELVLSENDFDEQTVLRAVEAAHRAGVKVRLAPTTTELLVRDAEYVPGQGVPLFELTHPRSRGPTGRSSGRSTSSERSAAPPPAAVVAAPRSRDQARVQGPVLFVDRRVGVGEREFGMLKFRTMIAGAASRQAELEAENEASGALFKIRDDPA